MNNSMIYFQASGLSDADIIKQFIVRKKEFEKVISVIKRDDMEGSIQHFIYIGQRGSGKSTLLRRIQAEINTDNQLNKRLIAVNLSEEQAGIYRLYDLWERVCNELSTQKFDIEEPDWDNYSDNPMDYTNALYFSMQKALEKKGKKLVLLLDNIDRILENIKKEENRLFRELMQNHKDFRIIGGSTRLSEHHWKYDEPFYEFFNIIRLLPLNQDEVKELLIFWSEFLEEPSLKQFVGHSEGKLNAVRILSDGMPRTMLHFVELLIKQPNEYGYEYLKMIVDRATPIYQERLGNLSPLQQKVVLEISFFWEAVKVKALSKTAKVESKTLSAVLGQLTDMQILEKVKGEGKNYAYRIKERFFNLWLIMTQGGPKQKNQAKYLTIFLETWYAPEELRNLYEIYSRDLRDKKVSPDRAALMTPAFAHSKHISAAERDDLIEQTKTMVKSDLNYYNQLPPKTSEIYDRVEELIENGKYEKAINHLHSIDQNEHYKSFLLGYINHCKGDIESAVKYYEKAAEEGVGDAIIILGLLYIKKGNLDQVEGFFKRVSKTGYPNGLLTLILMLYKQNKHKEIAALYVNKAVNEFGKMHPRSKPVHMILSLWIGETGIMSEAKVVMHQLGLDESTRTLELLIKGSLVHHQKNIVWNWFQDEKLGEPLKEIVRPLYYTAAHFINSKEAKQVRLSQPPELEETVQSIIENIRERQRFYYPEES